MTGLAQKMPAQVHKLISCSGTSGRQGVSAALLDEYEDCFKLLALVPQLDCLHATAAGRVQRRCADTVIVTVVE